MTPRRPDARDVDGVLAAAVSAICVVELGTGAATSLSLPTVLAAGLFGGPLVLRRTAPLAAAAAYIAVVLLHLAVDPGPEHAGGGWLASLLLAYAAGRYARRWWGLPELALLVVGIDLLWGTNAESVTSDLYFPALFAAVAWLGGRAVRWDVRAVATVHEEAVLLREQAERERERAQAAERRRIARDMHDVVAHSVSVMVVQAGGARRILRTDPARAAEAAELIRATGRDALAELRTLLGVIDGTPEASGAPAPSMADLGELVGRGREAGLDVRTDGTAELGDLPAGVDLAAYRIVQESLTNALRHAGAVPVTIRAARAGDAVTIEIVNGPAASGHPRRGLTRPGGHGLIGMAERAALYGGTLEAGPTEDGGYAVRTTLAFSDHRERTAT